MAAARFISKDFGGNDSSYVVNETALKVMKVKISEAIGKIISRNGKEAPIIGEVKDFSFKPVKHHRTIGDAWQFFRWLRCDENHSCQYPESNKFIAKMNKWLDNFIYRIHISV